MDKHSPIAVFDSGVGGVSVLRELVKLMPNENFYYFGDSANAPYGLKTTNQVWNLTVSAARKLFDEQDAKALVVACNTATAAAIKTLREEYSIPFIGMEPAIKPAAQLTKTGIVGVLATAGTLKAEKYKDTRGKYADDATVVEHVGQGFVELVESGQTTGAKAEAVVIESIEPLLDAGADTIVLGCTHYPFLSETISKVASALAPDRTVKIVDPAPAVARHLHEVMTERDIIRQDGYELTLHASGEGTTLQKIAQSL